jgi:hypothetical protein
VRRVHGTQNPLETFGVPSVRKKGKPDMGTMIMGKAAAAFEIPEMRGNDERTAALTEQVIENFAPFGTVWLLYFFPHVHGEEFVEDGLAETHEMTKPVQQGWRRGRAAARCVKPGQVFEGSAAGSSLNEKKPENDKKQADAKNPDAAVPIQPVQKTHPAKKTGFPGLRPMHAYFPEGK